MPAHGILGRLEDTYGAFLNSCRKKSAYVVSSFQDIVPDKFQKAILKQCSNQLWDRLFLEKVNSECQIE